jgi:hypothetical protein
VTTGAARFWLAIFLANSLFGSDAMALRDARVVSTHGVLEGTVLGRRLKSPDIIARFWAGTQSQ